jgi:hypothetical protein
MCERMRVCRCVCGDARVCFDAERHVRVRRRHEVPLLR